MVATKTPDRNSAFKTPEAVHKGIAQHILEFLSGEVKAGRVPKYLMPLQSGVGNIANAVLVGLNEGPFENMTSYTEVIQDGMLDMLRLGQAPRRVGYGVLGLARGPAAVQQEHRALPQADHPAPAGDLEQPGDHPPSRLHRDERIRRGRHLRPHELDPHRGQGNRERDRRLGRLRPELGLHDLHVSATAKGGKISAIVPFATTSTTPSTTSPGSSPSTASPTCAARARSSGPRRSSRRRLTPEFRPLLWDYFKRAYARTSAGRQCPHLLDEAFAFHTRYLKTGDMRSRK